MSASPHPTTTAEGSLECGPSVDNSTLKPTPIFVIGMPRSGTKWLSNLLSAHPDVASVQSERHRGILETSLFEATQAKFDLTSEDDYAAFVELWSQSDFLLTAGTDKRQLYSVPRSQRDYATLFEIMMDDLARRRGCRYWLQKFSPHTALRLLERFPTAKKVIIKRQMLDVLRSQAALNVRHQISFRRYQTVFDYVYQEKCAARILNKSPDTPLVTYEELRSDTQQTLRDLVRSLRLPQPDVELLSLYQPNSSFQKERSPLPPGVEWRARVLAGLLRLNPCWALVTASRMKQIVMGRPISTPFTSGEFGTLKDRVKAAQSWDSQNQERTDR